MSVTKDMDVYRGAILAVLLMPVTVIIGLYRIPIEYVEKSRCHPSNSATKAFEVS